MMVKFVGRALPAALALFVGLAVAKTVASASGSSHCRGTKQCPSTSTNMTTVSTTTTASTTTNTATTATTTPTTTTSQTTSTATTTSSPAADPSGEPIPTGDISGWHQTYAQDFNAASTIGSWTSGRCPYGSGGMASNPNYATGGGICAYPDGWTGTPSNGIYEPSGTLSSSNGILDYYLFSTYIDAAVPEISGASRVGADGGQLYGRYVVRARWDQIGSRHISFLLWPDSGNWPYDGEIDWPEGNMGSSDMTAFVHPQGATSCCSSQLAYDDPNIGTSTWHDYTIEWTPSAIRFYVDSTLLGEDTNASTIPKSPMHWVLQTNLSQSNTNYSLAAHLQIAWAVAYTPSS